MGDVRPGWTNPSGSVFVGNDANSLRRVFESLSQWLQYPLVGLARTTAFSVPNNAITPIPFLTELYDEFQLHDANASSWRVPTATRTYLAIGAVGVHWSSSISAGAYTQIAWAINGTNTAFKDGRTNIALFGGDLAIPFMGIVKAPQTMAINAFQTSGSAGSLTAEVWCMYLPMGS